jgi:hypothetical protein
MNLSAAIMLVRPDAVRPVRVEYDPDNKYNNNPTKVFKTVDKSIKKDDLVIVTTTTRHGFTVCKVVEVDFPVDYNSTEQWGWVAQKFLQGPDSHRGRRPEQGLQGPREQDAPGDHRRNGPRHRVL